MQTQIEELREQIKTALDAAASKEELVALHGKYLGRKGAISALMQQLGKLSKEERPAAGQLINQFRDWAEEAFSLLESGLQAKALASRYSAETVDVTMPGVSREVGTLHPISHVLSDLIRVFQGMGFTVYEGPEVEEDYYNFTALNVPKDHPARDKQDTFFITEETLLRTHTSPGQVRVLEQLKPPLKILIPGRVFRADDDATHTPMFHQLEGLVVDKGLNLCDLHGLLEALAKEMFSEEANIRFRPSYFPFTEPSVEVDVSCFECGGKGCRLCKGTGWIEILGAGVVNRRVLEYCGIDPDEYSGLAFGTGIERVAMLKYGINNIHILFDNDLRMLQQFK